MQNTNDSWSQLENLNLLTVQNRTEFKALEFGPVGNKERKSSFIPAIASLPIFGIIINTFLG